jgi:hypothetical protein
MELTYRAFGLTIGSELPLPGLPAGEGTPEIRIRRGKIPEWSGEPTVRYGERCKIRGQQWEIRFKALPFAGLVHDGNLVRFEADPEQDDSASLHVLGSCTGALLFQRGLVPIHANTVVTSHGAAMLVGRIGAGKSATTLTLLRRGHRLLADDISAISFAKTENGFSQTVLPGFPRLKLWRATLDHFQCDPAGFRRLRPGLEKYHYPVDDLFCEVPQELKAVYILQPRDEITRVKVRHLSGLAKLDAIRGHLYKIRFRDAVRNWPQLLGKVCQLADNVRINVVERPREGNSLEAVAEAIEKDLSESISAARG